MIIGTAGHIDHGKSALVEALTGRRMDRLAEERARGITIDLNFAPLRLGDGRVAGVVDVPGHEDFVRTMVAGAAGMDILLLVVAADEGIMPQTREHLAIAEALGIPHGIPVLTKSDLADPDWLNLVRDEVAEWLAGSSIAFTAPTAVSARSGDGLDQLRAALDRVAEQVEARDASAPFRMPIDRAFSVAGAGTVVTGTVWSGALESGATILILPGERPARVRSIESHGERGVRAVAGSRAALGLAGLDRADVRRGDVAVAGPLPWQSTTALDVRLDLLASAPRALTARTRVHLHLGTAEVLARVSPVRPIAPGESGLARLACEAPLLALGGDRFVIRSYSPVTTVGGGMVLDPLPPRRRPAWPDGLDAASPTIRARALVARHPSGVSSGLLALRAGAPAADLDTVLRDDPALRRVDDAWIFAAEVTAAGARALAAIADYHRLHPSLPGMPVETLRRATHRKADLADAALGDLATGGTIQLDAGLARMTGFSAGVAGGAAAIDRRGGARRGRGAHATDRPRTRPARWNASMRHRRFGLPRGRDGWRRSETSGTSADWHSISFGGLLQEIGAAGEITVPLLRDRTGLVEEVPDPAAGVGRPERRDPPSGRGATAHLTTCLKGRHLSVNLA